MDANSSRWHRVTPSTFPWEDEAIDFLRSRIADADPNRAWSNFEFISGGVISEVDVFLLTRKGAYLIEIKSTPGRLAGDQQRWTFHRPDGGRSPMENPLLVTNRKAKRIKSLLAAKWSKVAGPNAGREPPFIQPLVFLSDPNLEIGLDRDARAHICGRDGSSVTESGALPGIFAVVNGIGAVEANNPRFRQLNTPTTKAVADALDAIGIKESDHTRRVGSWVLRLGTVTERPGIQDFVADHQSSPGVQRRVRIYSKPVQMSDDQATSLRLAADREFLAAERVQHPNVVRAFERTDIDLGWAVVFEHDPTAVRLDLWMASLDEVTMDDRLGILRQLAETMQAVHRRKITHRALSPGSVLVRPGRDGEPPWVVMITDFSLAGRDHPASSAAQCLGTRGSRSRLGLPSAAPGDVELLADESALLFQAPERFTEDEPDGVSLDVFSFGAIAFQVLAGRPPGDTRDAVRQALHAGRGLQLSAVVPGVAGALHDLVLEATRPVVSDRSPSFDDVLAWLNLAEEELTAPTFGAEPEPSAVEVDPLDAKAGAVLADGAVVVRRLGRGSTAVALLVDRGESVAPRNVVYKVSLGGDADGRLRDEARILGDLKHNSVVTSHGLIELTGRPVLVEALAGERSLSEELRRNGTPGIEFLHRWGHDLLDAVRYLEDQGRAHRDIKPENLGVTEVGANKEQHLVLFDFSLASASSTDLGAGTPPYLDPFLAQRPEKRWDPAAERYAGAVTLYEMATGEVPQWGDGRSDPAFTTDEAALDAVLFDAAARGPLEDFFARALRRDPSERFGNGEEMLRAWGRVFDDLDVTQQVEAGDEDEAGAGPRRTSPGDLPESLSVDDPVVSLGASARVVSALDRLQVSTVRQLAALVPADVTRARRISPKVRRRILTLRGQVLARFADDLAATPRAATTVPDSSAPSAVVEIEPAGRLDLDALAPMLVPAAGSKGPKGSTQTAVRMMLGVVRVPGAEDDDWPSQSAVADALALTRGRLGQIGPTARRHWAQLEPLSSVRDEVVDLVVADGGVMAVRELEPLLIEARGSGLPPGQAAVAARAVIRAAIEAEESGTGPASRIVVRRRGRRVVVAIEPGVDGDRPDVGGPSLAAYATALGDRADEVVSVAGDVVPQDRAVTLLRGVVPPEGVSLGDGRLIRLAAASSQHVASSSSLELYPLDLAPLRAVRLARAALASATALTADEVRDRVHARFSGITLPERPGLDLVLADADVAVEWVEEEGKYLRADTAVGDLTSMTSVAQRRPTTFGRPPRRSAPPTEATDPAATQALGLEGRLVRSLDHGGFLALRVPTTQGPALRRELARFTGDPHRMVAVDLEAWFLDELRAEASEHKARWTTLLKADLAGPGSEDYTKLRILTAVAAAKVEQRVLAAGARVIAWNPGVLVRYSEMAVVDRLRNRAGLADSDLQTLWLVAFGPTTEPKPTIDGQPVPVLGASEWVDVPRAWLEFAHRHHLATAT